MNIRILKDVLTIWIIAPISSLVDSDANGSTTEPIDVSTISTTIIHHNFTDSLGLPPYSTNSLDAAAHNLSSTLCQAARSCALAEAGDMPSSLVMGCSCDDYCEIFGDCCQDKISSSASAIKALPTESYVCAPSSVFMYSVYMVISCPASYADSDVSRLCSNATLFMEPKADTVSTPVTSLVTGITYRNIYCATCWDQPKNQLITWLWRYTCSGNSSNGAYGSPIVHGNGTSTSSATVDLRTTNSIQPSESAVEYISKACRLTYDPPSSLVRPRNCTEGMISRCPTVGAVDIALQIGCSNGSVGYVYDSGGYLYRNIECAMCNGWSDASELMCQAPIFFGGAPLPSLSFSILLTPESGSCTDAFGDLQSNGGWTFSELCQSINKCTEGSPDAPGCSATCPQGMERFDGSCRPINGTYSCIFAKQPSAGFGIEVRNSTFLNNTLMVILNDTTALCFNCIVEQYKNFSIVNGSLFVGVGAKLRQYDSPMYSVEGDMAVACTVVTVVSAGGCSVIPDYVSAILLCLSEISLCLFFTAFLLLRKLRRFPGEMVLNQSIAFFLAFLFFLARPLAGESPPACTALAVLIHYFLIAAFAWTTLYSAEIAQALSFRVSEGVTRSRRIIYYTLAWGVPLVCIGIGIAADSLNWTFRPGYGLPQCFINARLGNQALFIGPVSIFLTIDIFVYGFMIIKLVVIARQTKAVRSVHQEKLFLGIKLIFSMGILWIFAVLASLTNSETLYCTFSLLNVLQGVFVFAVFVCKQDSLVELRRSMGLRTVRASSSSALTQLSTMSSMR